MNTFVKTFIICLIVTLSFMFYKFYSTESKSKEIKNVNKSVYSLQKVNPDKYLEQKPKQPLKELPQTASEEKVSAKNIHTCYFYNKQGKLIPVTREVNGNDNVKTAILVLLKGPLILESQSGMYSEIPTNVDLINVTYEGNKIIVNLTSNFGNGGGFDSIEHRIKQLSQTVKTAAPGKAVYLYINGKQVEYLGGDGVYVKQPLE